MPPSQNYTWTITEYNDLMARIQSLEYNRDFAAMRGAFNYVMDDGSGTTMDNTGGLVMLAASVAHNYSLPAPASEITLLELCNPSAVTHTVSVTGGMGFTSLTLAPGTSVVLTAATNGASSPQWIKR